MENIRIGNLEIAASDLPQKIKWTDISAVIEALGGNGWRLPTEKEFATIYHLYKIRAIGLKPAKYWSSFMKLGKALYYDLGVGYSPHMADVNNEYYVRLVRTI